MLGICFFTLGEITLKAPLQEVEKGVVCPPTFKVITNDGVCAQAAPNTIV